VVRPRAGITKAGCLFIALIIGAVGYVGITFGQVYFRYMKFKDAMGQEVRFRGDLADESIKARLQSVADSLGLPEEAGELTLKRERRVLTIESRYTEIVAFPGFRREIQFAPRAAGVY
jgi:hypothetical protein